MPMNLTNKTEEQLFTLFENCRDVLENQNDTIRHTKAKEIITQLNGEWDRRLDEPDNHPNTRPSVGMMAWLGYHVGATNGLTPVARRNIIDFVMTERLPFYYAPWYVKSWGEPNTKERYSKLEDFFWGMLRGPRGGDLDQAKDEWWKDLEYLKERYKDKFS